MITGASYAADWKTPALPGYQIVNRGVGGEETHQVLARFHRDVAEVRPSAVLIWGHINNIHRAPAGGVETAKERAKDDYRALVSAARAQGLTVVLATEVTLSDAVGWVNRVVMTINRLRGKEPYSAWVNGHVRELNAWLRSYAKAEGLMLLDFEAVFDNGSGFRKLEYSKEDGTHISTSGYAALTRYAQSRFTQK
jgi:lysophospholipase L1-like esterase